MAKKKKEPTVSENEFLPGVGLDIGTMNIVAARRMTSGKTRYKRIRDAFYLREADPSLHRMLKSGKMEFLTRKDEDGEPESYIVVGDDALDMAAMFGETPRRPLSSGLISSSEVDSLEILGVMLRSVLGDPVEEGEFCYFSIPAAPIDEDRDVIYHQMAFERLLEDLGYTPIPSNEAASIVYSEAAKDGFSGIGVSFGSGMVNVSLSVRAVTAMEFSVARGGDWIDSGVAGSVGVPQARVCKIKEAGVDLLDPGADKGDKKARVREGLSFYYRHLIDYTLKEIARYFKENCQVEVPDPVPMILSGGTSLAGGFVDTFHKVFRKHRRRFPIELSEIRHAEDPLNAVAQGLLVQAMQEYED